MRRVILRALPWTLAGFAIVGAALGMKFGGLGPKLAPALERLTTDALEISAALGLRLDAITVEGRAMTARDDLLAALDAERGAPILAIDVTKARDAIEALPWVKAATIERRLPNAVHVVLEERNAYALWQQGTRYTLVDRDGNTIIDIPEADQTLPLIVGPDAPAHAAALFEALGTEPDLHARVRAAVRVGARRWNIYLDTYEGGTAVRLPEENIDSAWKRLALLERDHKILERDLEFIDLRLEDRLIVRLRVHDAAKAVKPTPASKINAPAVEKDDVNT